MELLRFFLFVLLSCSFHEQKYILGEASLEHGCILAFFLTAHRRGVLFVLSGFLMAKSIFRRRASAASPNEYLRFRPQVHRHLPPALVAL